MLRIHYCKALKKTGKPIIVLDTDSGQEYNTDSIELKNVNIRVQFNNAKGKERKRGATTILEVF
jgi:hypothetical protein